MQKKSFHLLNLSEQTTLKRNISNASHKFSLQRIPTGLRVGRALPGRDEGKLPLAQSHSKKSVPLLKPVLSEEPRFAHQHRLMRDLSNESEQNRYVRLHTILPEVVRDDDRGVRLRGSHDTMLGSEESIDAQHSESGQAQNA